jgi:hypothetical protein
MKKNLKNLALISSALAIINSNINSNFFCKIEKKVESKNQNVFIKKIEEKKEIQIKKDVKLLKKFLDIALKDFIEKYKEFRKNNNLDTNFIVHKKYCQIAQNFADTLTKEEFAFDHNYNENNLFSNRVIPLLKLDKNILITEGITKIPIKNFKDSLNENDQNLIEYIYQINKKALQNFHNSKNHSKILTANKIKYIGYGIGFSKRYVYVVVIVGIKF